MQYSAPKLISERHVNTPKGWKALYLCMCGNEFVTFKRDVERLFVKSCGCWNRLVSKQRATKHGGRGIREYHVWKNMRQRCNNPNTPCYANRTKREVIWFEVSPTRSEKQVQLERQGCVFKGQEWLDNHELDSSKPCYCGRPKSPTNPEAGG